jgi:hypothetical protein
MDDGAHLINYGLIYPFIGPPVFIYSLIHLVLPNFIYIPTVVWQSDIMMPVSLNELR